MDAERKEKLGTKWTCYSCGQRFYDLNRPEPTCPKCQADQRESPAFQEKPKPRKAARKKAKASGSSRASTERVPTLDEFDAQASGGDSKTEEIGLDSIDEDDDDVSPEEVEV